MFERVLVLPILKHSLTAILDTKPKMIHDGFFELEMLEMFTGAFLLKIVIGI